MPEERRSAPWDGDVGRRTASQTEMVKSEASQTEMVKPEASQTAVALTQEPNNMPVLGQLMWLTHWLDSDWPPAGMAMTRAVS